MLFFNILVLVISIFSLGYFYYINSKLKVNSFLFNGKKIALKTEIVFCNSNGIIQDENKAVYQIHFFVKDIEYCIPVPYKIFELIKKNDKGEFIFGKFIKNNQEYLNLIPFLSKDNDFSFEILDKEISEHSIENYTKICKIVFGCCCLFSVVAFFLFLSSPILSLILSCLSILGISKFQPLKFFQESAYIPLTQYKSITKKDIQNLNEYSLLERELLALLKKNTTQIQEQKDTSEDVDFILETSDFLDEAILLEPVTTDEARQPEPVVADEARQPEPVVADEEDIFTNLEVDTLKTTSQKGLKTRRNKK